jgi:hypothetical protein
MATQQDPSRQWHRECVSVLQALKKHKSNNFFKLPVDAKQVPNYYTVIKRPMDMSKVTRRLMGNGPLVRAATARVTFICVLITCCDCPCDVHLCAYYVLRLLVSRSFVYLLRAATALVTFICDSFVLLLRCCDCSCDV